MSETYEIATVCTNCDHVGKAAIPKGTLVSDAMECPNCGCKTARKRTAQDVYKWYPPLPLVTPVIENPWPPAIPPAIPPRWNEPWCGPQDFATVSCDGTVAP